MQSTLKHALLYSFFFFSIIEGHSQSLHKIPTQELNLKELAPLIYSKTKTKLRDTITSFEISPLVTFKEYKEYLNCLKRDSSLNCYIQHLPDSSILPCSELYSQYLNSSKFDNEPVIGISWINALDFCYWKTLKDNPKNKLEFIYRIPICEEWLAANNYLSSKGIENDLNNTFSDWLLDQYYEFLNMNQKIYFFDFSDYEQAFDKKNKGWSRVLVIGNNFLHIEGGKSPLQMWRYLKKGYRFIGFRYVKEYINSEDESQLGNRILRFVRREKLNLPKFKWKDE